MNFNACKQECVTSRTVPPPSGRSAPSDGLSSVCLVCHSSPIAGGAETSSVQIATHSGTRGGRRPAWWRGTDSQYSDHVDEHAPGSEVCPWCGPIPTPSKSRVAAPCSQRNSGCRLGGGRRSLWGTGNALDVDWEGCSDYGIADIGRNPLNCTQKTSDLTWCE